ncbi:tetratricopeptide repeat protein [Engelhardtia mirabilis]|uniref:Outer membrane protein assembly factor BamD n=1 Tax=Engelhardtia mirabilis TaxID=2528011 RepID=A0A518BRY3_9BACT|nr:hypothetical protein Pla133_48450 [Planctomycetes bacterium Pla133]QDV04049.1 hypothetical protein Pla86_48430 [Planctomycetes bacterium Pla86]
MLSLRTSLAAAVTLLVAAQTVGADTITLVDGRKIADVTIQSEELAVVRYRQRNDREEVPTHQVLRIEYDRLPQAIDEADALVAEGQVEQALVELGYYVDASLSTNPDKRFPWGPAAAAKRAVEINASSNKLAATQAAASDLIARFPESRHVPDAYLAKAEAQVQSGDRESARATLTGLTELAKSRGLSDRYTLAAQVELAAIDGDRSGAKRIEALEQLEAQAGSTYPTVRDRALVAQGEVYLELANANPAERAAHLDSARTVFEQALESDGALPATRAGATVGLGDCNFLPASVANDAAGLQRAQMLYLRVVVLYGDEARYASKATFHAGSCFLQLADLNQDEQAKARGRRMMREVQRRYPDSVWADEAKRYVR